MKFQLLLCAIFCFSTITFVECKSYVFSGYEWKNEVRKCASGGGTGRDYLFGIGTLGSVGLKYEDINSRTVVAAYGDLRGHTGAVDNSVPNPFPLKKYGQSSNYKQFYGEWGYTAKSGWASQIIKIQLTVKFLSNGKVELTNYVYAGSWWAVTCAQTTSYVNKIEIIN